MGTPQDDRTINPAIVQSLVHTLEAYHDSMHEVDQTQPDSGGAIIPAHKAGGGPAECPGCYAFCAAQTELNRCGFLVPR